MPNRSIRASISSLTSALLLAGLMVIPSGAAAGSERRAAPIPYDVTGADRFSAGRVHGRDAYEGKGRGDRDWEPLREVRPADRIAKPLPVQVVHPSALPPVHEVVVRPKPEIVLAGEDRVFDQIRLDEAIQRCIFQNICTDEVKAIPGVYLGDEQEGDEDWTGRDDGLEVLTDNAPMDAEPEPPIPDSIDPFGLNSPDGGPGTKAPGRVFVEEPAE
ncbi:hypothetical protein [Marinobacterium weihaiense]|uniref:Secreted protein n=1 Tax=Marinobacterium weihaiense TaxID=2851016 RepID=A0ABS6MAD3_9GAMM|nr:hypothetical protein [Marinobacterium weihaiense]MBV0932717.1 hypothetical protein [Marinobacterium weihaiense]